MYVLPVSGTPYTKNLCIGLVSGKLYPPIYRLAGLSVCILVYVLHTVSANERILYVIYAGKVFMYIYLRGIYL